MGSATLRFGLLPDGGGQYLLVQHLGVARAMGFLMRKRIVDAEEAHRLGLVHEVAPDAELHERAMALAEELANGPQVSMRLLKRSIYNAAELSFEQSLDEIASKTVISDHHPDAREGGTLAECLDLEATHHVHASFTQDHKNAVKVFVEKREPVFEGR